MVSTSTSNPTSTRQEPKKTGHVARILSERELVITLGQVDGVKVGDVFEVLADDVLPISDPQTGEKLGTVPMVKLSVRAKDVYERITVCETRTYWVPSPFEEFMNQQLLVSAASLSAVGGGETRHESIKTDQMDKPTKLTQQQQMVRIGDPVRRASVAALR